MNLNTSILKIILVVVISLFFVEKTFAQTGCEGCTITNPTGGQNATLTVNVGDVICFTQDRTFGDLRILGGTICIAEGVKVTIINNVFTTIGTNINLEIYGTLQFNQVPTMRATVNANIYSKGVLRSGETGNNDFYFDGSGNNYINNFGEIDMGVLSFRNNSSSFYFDNFGKINLSSNLNITANITKFKNNPGSTLTIGASFTMNQGTEFYNCGTTTTSGGFNMGGENVINTGSFTVNGNINYAMSSARIDNYGTFNVNNGNIQMGNNAVFYNEGVTIISNGTFERDGHILGPEDGLGKLGYIYFDRPTIMNRGSIGPNINFKNTATGGVSSFAVMFQGRTNITQKTGVSWDCESTGTCAAPKQTFLDLCTDFDGNFPRRYWTGIDSEDFGTPSNWTTKIIPLDGEDVEFATDDNNGPTGDGDKTGAAVRDLHLDKDRIIGDLINKSDKDLIVTTERQLIINGKVKDDNTGGIVVKAVADAAMGTLKFADPAKNSNVAATVQFYNKAYECATCGFYRKQWQYFGIPVQLSYFPYLSPQVETVNQWVEPYIYSNKWRPAPYTPDLTLKAFKGYEMTNSNDTEPTHIYSFPGILNVGDATVGVTKTANVDYSGMNLLSNSFTAAIPITSAAIALGSVELKSNTVYLFNMGTRDQWRKLNGGSAYGVAAGQYQAVPFNLAGQAGIPDRILSMHTFMLDVITPGNITLKYDQLLKNELNASTVKPWKSAELRSSTIQLPHIVMDVISNGSADRVWLFEEADATTEFDNGWDGYKMKEGDLIQTYVLGSDQSDYQIATVPEIIGTTIGVSSGLNEKYSINFSVTPDVESRTLFLRDLFTGRNYSIKNNAEYVINGTNNSNNNRFKIVASSSSLIDEDIMSSPINIYVMNNIIIVDNQSEEDCSVMVYDLMGRLVANKQAPKSQITEFTNISQNKTGVYIVKVLGESNSINKTDRVLLR